MLYVCMVCMRITRWTKLKALFSSLPTCSVCLHTLALHMYSWRARNNRIYILQKERGRVREKCENVMEREIIHKQMTGGTHARHAYTSESDDRIGYRQYIWPKCRAGNILFMDSTYLGALFVLLLLRLLPLSISFHPVWLQWCRRRRWGCCCCCLSCCYCYQFTRYYYFMRFDVLTCVFVCAYDSEMNYREYSKRNMLKSALLNLHFWNWSYIFFLYLFIKFLWSHSTKSFSLIKKKDF